MSLRRVKFFFLCWAALLFAFHWPKQAGGTVLPEASEQDALPPELPAQIPSRSTMTTSQPQPTFKGLPRQIIRDQGFLWVRPFRMKRSDLPWVGLMVGSTAGLMAVDRRVGQGLSASPPGSGYTFTHCVGQLGGPWTDLAVAGSIYLVGRSRNDQHTQATGLLSLQAIGDSLLVVEILKVVTQRPRPTPPGGVIRNHEADGEFFTGGSAFPSGHAATAFALATVVTERSRGRPWVGPVSYGLASLVSVSRVTGRAHFPSDVFVGAALGFLIGRHVVHDAERSTQSKLPRSKFVPSIYPTGRTAISLSWEF